MFIGEVVAMMFTFGVLGASFMSVVGAGAWLVNRVTTQYFNHLERELEMRRFEAQSRVEQARVQHSVPVWVDRNDPMELAAWNRAVAETWRVSARALLPRSDA